MSSILLCVYHIFFICSSVDGHLGCFHILEIINNVAMSIEVHVSFRISVLVLLDISPRMELLADMVVFSIFSVLRSLHAVFHNGCYC